MQVPVSLNSRKNSTFSWDYKSEENQDVDSKKDEDSISTLSQFIRIKLSSINEKTDLIKAKTVYEYFSLSTGLHGFAKLVRTTKVLRIVWTIFIIIALVALTIQLGFAVARYIALEIVASVSYGNLGFAIPDVTICPGQRFFLYIGQQTVTVPPPILMENTYVYLNTSKQDNQKFSFLDLWNNTVNSWTQIFISNIENQTLLSKAIESVNSISRASLMTISVKAGVYRHPLSIVTQMILNKKHYELFNDIGINFTIVRPVLTSNKGVCVTLSVPDSVYQSIKSDANATAFTTLDFMLLLPFIGTDDSEELRTHTTEEDLNYLAGASVIFHPRGTWYGGYIDQATILVNRGEKVKATVVETNLQKINLAYKPCRDSMPKVYLRQSPPLQNSNEAYELMDYEYTDVTCKQLQNQRIMFHKCGCLSDKFPVPSDLPEKATSCFAISIELMTASSISKTSTSWILNNQGIVLNMNNDEISMIYARYNCHEIYYDLIASGNISSLNIDMTKFPTCPILCNTITYSSYVNTELMPRIMATKIGNNLGGDPLYIVNHYNYTLQQWMKFKQPSGVLRKIVQDMVYEYTGTIGGIVPADILGILRIKTPEIGSDALISVVENLAYPLSTFLSDVGGIAGLWIGISAVTATELTELIAMFIAAKYLHHNKNK